MSPDGGIGRRAGLKILLAVKSVSVRPRFWALRKTNKTLEVIAYQGFFV